MANTESTRAVAQSQITIACLVCGKSFIAYRSDHRRFCSVECSRGHRRLRKHGESKTRLHSAWCSMKHRCQSDAPECRPWYKDRSIVVCAEWAESYEAFRAWALANGYADNLEIDRIDSDKGYSPDNCRWVTRRQQMRNTRSHNKPGRTSRYKGVGKLPSGNWRATICRDGRPRHLGVFPTEQSAAIAYDAAAREQYGEFAHTNF